MFYPGWTDGSFCRYTFGICSKIKDAQKLADTDYIDGNKAAIMNSRPENSAAVMQLIHYGSLVHVD